MRGGRTVRSTDPQGAFPLSRRVFVISGGLALTTLLPAGCAIAEDTAAAPVALTSATERRVVRMQFPTQPGEMLTRLLTQVDLYDPTITQVRFDHARSETPGEMGVGSVRICVFDDGRELHEPLVAYDPPSSYAYTVDADASTMSLPVREIVLAYAFAPATDGGTDVTVRAFFDPSIPGTGPIIGPVLTGTLRRTFTRATEVFGGTYLGDARP